MACGLKKQNNQGGVHLTERTCSPYNPIIKLMIDDCLGLPIYPVTSVDAVIDEDGYTLRKWLQNALDSIKNETGDVTNDIDQIIAALLQLTADSTANNNANVEEIKKLRALVWAITTLTENIPEDASTQTTGKPYIVQKIKELETTILNLDVPEGIEDTINDLKALLLAVANFNEDSYTADGLVPTEAGRIKIIQEILDIKAQLEDLSSIEWPTPDPNPDSTGDIFQRIQYLLNEVEVLNNNILEILQHNKYCAHLDPDVLGLVPMLAAMIMSPGSKEFGFEDGKTPSLPLDQLPENTGGGSGNSGEGGSSGNDGNKEPETGDNSGEPSDNPTTEDPTQNEPTDTEETEEDPLILYKKLKASEYPVTSIYIITRDTNLLSLETDVDRFIYYGNIKGQPVTSGGLYPADIYPFGHTVQDFGLLLYRKVDDTYEEVLDDNGTPLRAGNGHISTYDLQEVIKIILTNSDRNTKYSLYFEGRKLNLYYRDPNNENEYFQIADIGRQISRIGIHNDGEINVNDINGYVDIILDGNIGDGMTPVEESNEYNISKYIEYYPANSVEPTIFYPCIDGKIYFDLGSKKLFRFDASKEIMVEIKLVEPETIKSNLTRIDCDLPYLFGPCDADPQLTTLVNEDGSLKFDEETGELKFLYNPNSINDISLEEGEYSTEDLSDFLYSEYFLTKLDKIAEAYEEAADEEFTENAEVNIYEADEETLQVLEFTNGEANTYLVNVYITYIKQDNDKSYYIRFTISNKIPASDTKVYSLINYGLEIRFNIDEELNYTPIITSLEKSKRDLNITEADTPIEVKCNKFLSVTSTQPITFDANEFTLIPGHEVIEVKGRFSSSDNTAITVVPNEILLNGNNPSLVADNVYEFSILDGVLSYKDVTPVLI